MDTTDPNGPKFVPLLGRKWEFVNYLRSNEDRISWTVVVNSIFFDDSLQMPGIMGWDIANAKATIFDGGDVKDEATNVDTVGMAVTAALAREHQVSSANQYVYVNSFTVIQYAVLASLEKELGMRFEVQEETSRELRDGALERQWDYPEYAMVAKDLIVASLHGQDGVNLYAKNASSGLWNDRLGLEESVEERVREMVS